MIIFQQLRTCIEDEVVSIGDSGSDNDFDESQYASGDNHSNINGYDYPTTKKARLLVNTQNVRDSNSPNLNLTRNVFFLCFSQFLSFMHFRANLNCAARSAEWLLHISIASTIAIRQCTIEQNVGDKSIAIQHDQSGAGA